MSSTALAAAALFGVWLAGSLCFAFQIPRLSTLLNQVNQFRVFCKWTMFMVSEDGFSWFVLEYRRADDTGEPWQRWTPWLGWRPLGWIIAPERPRAEALQRLGMNLERRLRVTAAADRQQLARPYERLFEDLLDAHNPRRPAHARDIRLIKVDARSADPAAIWSFTAVGGGHD